MTFFSLILNIPIFGVAALDNRGSFESQGLHDDLYADLEKQPKKGILNP